MKRDAEHNVAMGPEYYDKVYGEHRNQDWDSFRGLAEEACKHAIGSVLDLGCGFGFVSEFAPGPYLGVDFSPVAIQRAKELYPEAEFVLADFHTFEPPKTFDTVVMIEVLEHLDDPAWAIAFAKRWADQKIIVSVPNHMRTTGHVWPCWTGGDVRRLLGQGSRSWKYGKRRFGVWEVNP